MRYHLIGIKGSGMSALAAILKQQNNEVTGSDIDKEVFTQENLDKNNIKYYNFDEKNITADIDEIIVGNVFDESNIEYKKAVELNIKITNYTKFLNILTNRYDTIAVCGTNGKTTTTSLLNQAFANENKMTLIGDSRGYSTTDPQMFILEACEYKSNFLNYNSDICLINNIEMDHPDYFKDINQVNDLFIEFANNSNTVVLNNDDENCRIVKDNIKDKKVITFGVNSLSDVQVLKSNKDKSGYILTIKYGDVIKEDVLLPFFGEHMLYNSLATIAVGYAKKINFEELYNELIKFSGAKRRFEETIIDKDNNIILIDDYAHHPTSVKMTIDAIKQKYPNYTLTTIFQAHTFSRVNEFKDEFALSLNSSDYIYIADIFGSIREQESDISSNVIKEQIDSNKLISELSDLLKYKNNHIIALLGAGDIDKLYKDRIKDLFKGE